jgi:ectoine hydroxylase-related dioxygenase (phytanoyl-CoA dioxygenase family)
MEESTKYKYDLDGFLALQSVFSTQEIDEMCDEVARLEAAHPEVCTFEDWRHGNERKVLHKISRFVEKSSLFEELAVSQPILLVIQSIWEEECLLCTDKVNYKLPGGRGFYPHQDMSGIWSKYVPNFMSVFIALDNSDESNGCLQVSKGNHTIGLLGPKMKPIPEKNLVDIVWQPVPQKRGDVLFFDGLLPHQSDSNESDIARKVLIFTYTRASDGNFRPTYLSGKM